MSTTRPTRSQVAAAARVSAWYLERYHGTPDDLGVPAMFTRRDLVGSFALTEDEFSEGRPQALFRMLVATTLFQRRQDQQVMRILRGLANSQVNELTHARGLLKQAAQTACPHAVSQSTLLSECDLTKDLEGRAVCSRNPNLACALKEHSVWLKRYGHFGKVPTSAALMLRESGVRDLAELYSVVVGANETPRARAVAMEAALRQVWRVSEKISAMFLSAVCNIDLGSLRPPWLELDSSYFVVIDSNTDLFLEAIGYRGAKTYSARREFLWRIAERVDLSALKRGVRAYNPRIVQQAAYLMMSRVNRRAMTLDCSRQGICHLCPRPLRALCPLAPT